MDGPSPYTPMADPAKRIQELVARGRYTSSDAFIDRAVSMLLAWESEQPQDTIRIMQSMMPFTPEQEEFLKGKIKGAEPTKGQGESGGEEPARHAVLGISDLDHRRVRQNLDKVAEHMAKWAAPEAPAGAYEYDGYPLLFNMYSRFLPVRITVAVLANMLYESGGDYVNLDSLRGAAYDIAEEIGGHLAANEKKDGVGRNKRASTGLPTKVADDSQAGVEKRAHRQKRFKDQYVGRVRRDKEAWEGHGDGAPAALGLVTMFEKDGKTAVTLTDAGRRLCMLRNPVVSGDYGGGMALGAEEAALILDELLPRLPLEHAFANAAVEAAEKAGPAGVTTPEMDRIFLGKAVEFAKKNAKAGSMLGLNRLDKKTTDARIVAWRVATMGRLAEIGAVEWRVGKDGSSVFHPTKSGGGAAEHQVREGAMPTVPARMR